MGTDKEGFLEEVILAQSLGEQEGTESDVGGRGSPEASLGTCVVCLKEDLWWPEGVGRTGGHRRSVLQVRRAGHAEDAGIRSWRSMGPCEGF